MDRMVAGFLLWRRQVLLVRKTHPQWQAGLLNGIGGGIEGGESPVEAQRREFREETGLDVGENSAGPAPWWHCFAVERHPGYEVHFHRASVLEIDPMPLVPMANDRGERLVWLPLSWLLAVDPPMGMVGNLRWLLPMAMDWRMLCAQIFVGGDIKERPSW